MLEAFFAANPIEAQVVLASLPEASELLHRLLDRGHSAVAGRLAGALRHLGRQDVADEIVTTMKSASYNVRESDPFAGPAPAAVSSTAAPIVGRMQAMWVSMPGKVLEVFPSPPGLPKDKAAYRRSVDDVYRSDAYNSLSIEGYNVSVDLM